MSSTKTSVGEVYGKIVNDVIESSRTAFEEGGIDMSSLDLLQEKWKQKLTEFKVTSLPWDPVQAPTAKEAPLPAMKQQPQNGGFSPVSTQSPLNTLPPNKADSAHAYPNHSPAPSYPVPTFPQGQPMTAQERAAMNLHRNFGDRAGAQIAQLQSGHSLPTQMPQIKQEDRKDDYRNGSNQQSPPIKLDQTDGAGDSLDEWKAEYARRKEAFKQARGQNIHLIRDHVGASLQDLEGGGLMVPLRQRIQYPADSIIDAEAPANAGRSRLARAQGDAAGDADEEEDENAINSDLDDPEDAADGIDGEGDDDPDVRGNIMLCTYDKVQRVKNKWKCTLKDGILGANGTDYLFHKGQGEFEW